MRLGWAEPALSEAGAAGPPFGADADCSGGRVVGALTMTLYLLNPVRICLKDLKSVLGQEKTPVSWVAVRGSRVDAGLLCPTEGKRGINALPNYYEQDLHNGRP
jgi:hypothetical protein